MKIPNVIVVLCDQLRAFELGCYGNPHIRTPHLDRLASEGLRFETGLTNNPVCTPARSCLLTGQYGRTCTGELGNVADDPPCRTRRRLVDTTLAEAFRAAGYETALIGKWHVDPDPALVGFDHACFPLTVHRNYRQRFIENGVWSPPVERFAPEYELDRLDDFLRRDRAKPFFLFYNISPPHGPIGPTQLPAQYVNAYNGATLPLRDNVFVDGRMAHSERWFKIYREWSYFWRMAGRPCWNAAPECGYPDPTTGELPDDALPEGFTLRDLYALYYGATKCVDDIVGRLLDKLSAQGRGRETLILFTSDHGDNLGSHHLFNKDCLYEESIRIPWILRWPGRVKPGVNTAQQAELIDVMPTLLDLCGIETPPSVQGTSLAPVVRGKTDRVGEQETYIETDPFLFGRPTVGIRTPTHLYGAHTDGQAGALAEGWGLFDLAADPLQQRNLLGQSGIAATEADLRGRLNAWHQGTPWLGVARDAPARFLSRDP